MGAPVYVDRDYVIAVTPLQAGDVDTLETVWPGAFDRVASSVSRIFDAYLRKRYAAPFQPSDDPDAPFPEALRKHVANVVAFELAMKRGFNFGSKQDEAFKQMRDESLSWLKEAANSLDGTPELPLRDTGAVGGDASGVSKKGPLMMSDSDPYSVLRPSGGGFE